MPEGAVTTFILADASGLQTIVYEVAVPEIPATSTWGIIVLAIGCLTAGAIMLRGRKIPLNPLSKRGLRGGSATRK